MIKKILRELYLLPLGEQRAVILLSLLLMLSILIRVAVQMLPGQDPPGMEDFVKESQAIMAAILREDSLERSQNQNPVKAASYSSSFGTSVNRRPGRSIQELSPININTADSSMLLPLPGIGPVFAGRIIRYRNLLGGFTNVDQLREVYGMKEETIHVIREYILIDTTAIRKISLDSVSFRNMLRHPYLQLEDVEVLVEYRDFKGGFSSIQEIRDNKLLSDSILQKVGPYFQFYK